MEFEYTILENITVKILFISREKYDKHLSFFLSIIFENPPFLSFNISPDEISVIIEEKTYQKVKDKFEPDCFEDEKEYSVVQIHENQSGINHIGVVSKISAIFSENNIPILYINTFNNNYIIIPKNKESEVESILKNKID